MLIIIFVSGCIQTGIQKNETHELEYNNRTYIFKADISDIYDIPLYPNDQEMADFLTDKSRTKLYIAFFDTPGENMFCGIASYEITMKLAKIREKSFRTAESIILNNTEELDRYRSNSTILVLMLGPSRTERTAVTLGDNLITLEAKDLTEIGDYYYTELDAAVARMFMSVVG